MAMIRAHRAAALVAPLGAMLIGMIAGMLIGMGPAAPQTAAPPSGPSEPGGPASASSPSSPSGGGIFEPGLADAGLLIYGEAPGATVYVDGKRRGQMPMSAANAFRVVLPPGDHTIELRRDGFNAFYAFASRATVSLQPEALLPVTLPPLLPVPLPGVEQRINGVVAAFLEETVAIPAGSFLMGGREEENSADAEFPRHRVEVGAFRLQRFGVTFDMWDACVADGGCSHIADDMGLGRGAREVFDVNWNDGRRFARWLSGRLGRQCRLPSEAEWEYAARGGTQTAWSFGDNPARLRDYVASGSDLPNAQRPKLPNGYGVYGMAGGLTEWVGDFWHDSYDGAPTDGSVWNAPNCKARVVRGGFWDASAWYMRSARRGAMNPLNRYPYVGLRLACEADPPPGR